MCTNVRIWGEYACFTRPEFKVERVTYEVPTVSACIGILDNIYLKKDEMKWLVDRIHILNPIKLTNITRNERKGKFPNKDVNESIQRNSLILCDVDYVIEPRFILKENSQESGKYGNIWNKRLYNGMCYQQPYLGCREFSAYFEPCPNVPKSKIRGTYDLGLMFCGINYDTGKNRYMETVMEDGIIDVKNSKIIEQ